MEKYTCLQRFFVITVARPALQTVELITFTQDLYLLTLNVAIPCI